MKKVNNIELSLRNLQVRTRAALDERILTDASAALAESSKRQPASKQSKLWIRRTIMKSPWTKFAAAAAAIVVVVILWLTLVNKSGTPAYALEQTIQANHSVRTIHIKKFTPRVEQPEEFWAEFYESGELLRCRMNFPQTEDGPKAIVWQQNKAEVWQEAKNMYAIIKDKSISEQLRQTMEVVDPKLAVQNLHHLQTEGKVKLEIAEPPRKDESIRVTATYLENSHAQGRRVVLTVDSTTKLVGQIEFYHLNKGEYQYEGRLEIQDYNRPIGPEMFTLNIPADAIRIDQTIQEVGLPQGDLSKEEIAVKVVREFLEAMIAKDCAKASKLYQGLPVELFEKQVGKMNFVRIISIDKPTPSDRNNSLRVPCKYEVEVDGKKSVVQSQVYVRPVFGQPDRWTIDGGI